MLTEDLMEEYALISINTAQKLENEIMLVLLNEFKAYIENPTSKQQSLGLNNTRKEVDNAIKLLLSELVDKNEQAITNAGMQTLEDLSTGETLKYYGVDSHIKTINNNMKKYITTKGLVLDKQKLETFFYNLCQDELKQVTLGAKSLEETIESAIKKMAQSGVKVIDYESGVTRNLDVFVRQELLYAQKQSTLDIKEKFAKENNITVWEADAHGNARPTHKIWQGKRWDTTGKLYPTFQELSRGQSSYKDYGCLHIITPVTDPYSPLQYTDEELASLDTKPFTYEGKEYDGYEAKQKMRAMEREIRALKREYNLREESNLSTDEINQKIKAKTKKYRNFCTLAGTYPKYNRIRVNI